MSMDSATSESFQSSNGPAPADFDDFDSRPPPDPLSSFLNLPPPIPRPLFDPFPSYPSNSFLSDLDPAPSWPLPPDSTLNSTAALASSSAAAAPRASKKRARASRRAPTTVLTTDTSNFRAMVQEFTGIPAPPFATSSVFSSPRLDLFHHPPSSSGFLLRPFAQKRQATGLAGISSNALPSTSTTIQSQNFMFQEQQRAAGLWGYGGGGELGSVIAGASAEAELKRAGCREADPTGSALSEKRAGEGFSTSTAAAARGEGGMDAWQLSSD